MTASLFLVLSIACSTLINLIFRWFKIHNIHKLEAIVVNYLVCFGLGYTLSPEGLELTTLTTPWFQYSFGLGTLFVGVFLAMAHTTDKLGISVNAVSSKMSVIVPVLVAFVLLKEEIHWIYVVGLLLSLASIWFISVRKEIHINRHYALLPLIVFLGSGFIDTSLKMLQTTFKQDARLDQISYSIFLGAFTTGLVVILISFLRKRKWPSIRSLVAGTALGIPNYFSIYFLLAAIAGFEGNSAFVFGVNNISIVLFSSLLSVAFFHEKLSRKNKLGLALAVISILLIQYGHG